MNNKTKYNKEKAEEIKKQLTELFLKSETKPVSFSRKKMAEELDCSPNHITYILKKMNAKNYYTIRTQKGYNGHISIIKNPNTKILTNLTKTKKISVNREKEIQIIESLEIKPYLQNLSILNIFSPLELDLLKTLFHTALMASNSKKDSETVNLFISTINNFIKEKSKSKNNK